MLTGLHPSLVELGQRRLNDLLVDEMESSAGSSELTATEQAKRDKQIYLLAMSDFVHRNCQRYVDVKNALLHHVDNIELPRWPYSESNWVALSEPEAMQALRCHRQAFMSALAAKHFLKQIDIVHCMRELSESADLFFALARTWSEHHLAARWGRAVDENGQPISLIALGMGKLGGYELNFSSDIDLIFCYAEKGTTKGGRKQEDFQSYFTRVAQKVIHLLDAMTADGQVFRVDMRLRPFGDSGPLVSSFAALEDYYQEQGREWERYALLKARPLAHPTLTPSCEILAHFKLLQMLKPFVYRRYIDFSVIESLRSMKRQIESEVSRRKLVNNIKLGTGGIREAEFIVQALQMLRGGKEPQLQQPSFLAVLPELARLHVFSVPEAHGIELSYLWFRECEQYLQAFDDKQTQTLPSDELNQNRLLALYQQPDWTQLLALVEKNSQCIHSVFDELIGDEPDTKKRPIDPLTQFWQQQWLTDPQKNLASEIDAELSLVAELPHRELLDVLLDQRKELIKSVISSKGRERLDRLLPILMSECSRQKVSVEQCRDILAIVKRIATRTTYLALLVEHPGALTQLVKLVSSCHFIGQELKNFPLLLDQLIDPKLLYSVPDLASYESDLRRNLLRVAPDDLELQMEILRQFKLSSQLIIAACDVEGIINLTKVSDHLTALAEAVLEQVVNLAWRQMVDRYGYPDGADEENRNFAVIGYGKLGGHELGYGSDLDVVFVHGCQSATGTSGSKSIDSRQFYLKLAQRILHFFTTRTSSGILYELDTRLRPSGESGLLAININTFAEYQQNEAWTWEHQALVRARGINGSLHLIEQFNAIRKEILTKSRAPESLKSDISGMRHKMHANLSKETSELFDIKQSRGGMADIEFITQYLVLSNAHQYEMLAGFSDNKRLLALFAEYNLLTETQTSDLWLAYEEYRELYHQASLNLQPKLIAAHRVNEHAQGVSRIWTEVGLN